jgi:hypothetical protein
MSGDTLEMLISAKDPTAVQLNRQSFLERLKINSIFRLMKMSPGSGDTQGIRISAKEPTAVQLNRQSFLDSFKLNRFFRLIKMSPGDTLERRISAKYPVAVQIEWYFYNGENN